MSDQPSLFAPAPTYEAIPTDAQVPIPPGTYADHQALTAHCEVCRRCRLAEQRTKVAVSRGNPNAALMLIGEGPGQQEDLQGKPFVGPAGQLLDQILQSVKLDPIIVNAVKCRPPGNRVPEPDEMAACKGYWQEQVRLVQPKLLLLVGGVAAKGVLGEQRGITKLRGQWTTYQGIPTMPIFHPSYLLRNPIRDKGGPKWLMWQDIQEVRRRLDEVTSG